MNHASLLVVFVPTFAMVSATPGLCMTLALSLGMTVGVRRALWMMVGELVGVGVVAVLSVIGAATVFVQYPNLFVVFKLAGGAYLVWIGIGMWAARGRMAMAEAGRQPQTIGRGPLLRQGLVTAIANPKGWAFFIALLPPFLDFEQPLAPQLGFLVSLILLIEFTSLMAYASGGHTVGRLLNRTENVRLLNRVAGTLIIGVGIWLALS